MQDFISVFWQAKITEKQWQVRNFAEVRNFTWHRVGKKNTESCRRRLRIHAPPLGQGSHWPPEVAGVTFSDSDSAPAPKFLNPGPAILQIWESDSCSDSGYNHRSIRNLPMFLLKKWPHRILLLPKWKSDSEFGFSQIFDSGSERKTQNSSGVDSGNPDPIPPLLATSYFVFVAEVCGLCFFLRNILTQPFLYLTSASN